MGVWDARCNICNKTYEFTGPSYMAPGSCEHCGSDDTRIVWLSGFPAVDRAKDPYDLIETGTIKESGKTVKSFANDRRKGGKDTT